MTAAKAVKPVDTAKAANLGVLFAIEVGVLVAVGYWGFTRDIATPLTWLLGIGGPVVLAVVWGLCGSPKARYKVRGAGRVAFEVVWFGAGAVALVLAGVYDWALVLALVCVVSKTLAVIWRQ
ncbi:YrdB family protein [Streptomyces sp. NBC_00343]|uniref:YrdB family protein n=1 Tax=Streptomyces sp. NBC_00343 TaxID=2975719 RepID=UPI002E2D963D|nr:YrdB family protein [Streptomyces sp. NBC_00343]